MRVERKMTAYDSDGHQGVVELAAALIVASEQRTRSKVVDKKVV